jgi:hypothetical protein
VVLVVAFSAAVGMLLIPRLSFNLSGLNQFSGVLPSSGTPTRRLIEPTATPAAVATPTPAPATPTPAPTTVADRFAGSTVTVSSANPPLNSPETILVQLRRDGQPAANVEVWSTVQYRTTLERWPATGSVRTDQTGAASITFNVGQATPGYQVEVHVFARVDGEEPSWSTTFTPR